MTMGSPEMKEALIGLVIIVVLAAFESRENARYGGSSEPYKRSKMENAPANNVRIARD
jgi:hypothetical protein